MPQSNAEPRPALLTLIAATTIAARVNMALAIIIGGLPSVIQELVIQWLLRTLPRNSVIVIHRRADLSLLRNRENVVAVILRDTQLAEEVSLRLAISAGDDSTAASLIIFGDMLTDIDLALPSLRVEADAAMIRTAHQWLTNNRTIDENSLIDHSDFGIRFSSHLKHTLLNHDDAAAGCLIGTVLLRLMAGLCQLSPQRSDASIIELLPKDYDLARSLLESCAVRPGGDLANPLALAMARRAAMWLGESDKKPDDTKPNVITRREVVDLGNPRSRTCKDLLQHVLVRYGFTNPELHVLGLTRKPDLARMVRLDLAINELRDCLITWTIKQVRTHFHRLYLDGLLTGDKVDGRWKYRLPEALKTGRTNWTHLPTAAELFSPPLERPIIGPPDGPTEVV